MLLKLEEVLPEAGSQSWLDGFERELRLGFELEKATQKARAIAAQQHENGVARKHIDGLGEKIATIDARTYFRWLQEDEDFWNDRSNVIRFVKDNPEYKPPAAEKKTMVVV